MDWSSVFSTGLSGYFDSQTAKYQANAAQYNTEGGTAGQAQVTASGVSSTVLMIGGLALVGVVLLIALKR